ncbi:MAG TPA: hypothetical protein VF007_00705 [Stellaceae bacterium]
MSGRHRLCLPVLAVAVLIGAAATASAQTPPRSESAQQNVRESEQYERAICSNAAFRAKRIKQECDPITDPQLHESCLATFNCGPGAQHRRRSNKAPPSETIR